jgi:hypothetical protein
MTAAPAATHLKPMGERWLPRPPNRDSTIGRTCVGTVPLGVQSPHHHYHQPLPPLVPRAHLLHVAQVRVVHKVAPALHVRRGAAASAVVSPPVVRLREGRRVVVHAELRVHQRQVAQVARDGGVGAGVPPQQGRHGGVSLLAVVHAGLRVHVQRQLQRVAHRVVGRVQPRDEGGRVGEEGCVPVVPAPPAAVGVGGGEVVVVPARARPHAAVRRRVPQKWPTHHPPKHSDPHPHAPVHVQHQVGEGDGVVGVAPQHLRHHRALAVHVVTATGGRGGGGDTDRAQAMQGRGVNCEGAA